MDYEKKYKEKLKAAKYWHDASEGDIPAVLEEIFPELKESENESIRKKAIEYIEAFVPYDDKDDIIAWLKKQGENNTGISDATKQKLEGNLNKALEQETLESWQDKFLGKQSGQKSTFRIDNSVAKVVFPFKAKVKSTGIVVTIHGGQLSVDGKEWIKYQSDKEDGYSVYEPEDLEPVCNVESKYIWSEEDKIMLEELLDYCDTSIQYHGIRDQYGIKWSERKEWLKSLKDRCTLKTSDEHYELEEFAKIVRCNIAGISKAVQELFEAKYLQLTGNKMYGGYKD